MREADGIERSFQMIAADGRRSLDEDQERAAKGLWRKVFRATPEKALLEAVQTWLVEHARGRPNIGEILSTLRALAPSQDGSSSSSSRSALDVSGELRWAAGVLEAYDRNLDWRERMQRPEYAHTLSSARHALRRRGFSAWQDARSHVEPTWTPPVTTEEIP